MIVLDGGMGRELARVGAPFRQPEWSALALIEKPETVRTVHDSFAQAGGGRLTTNAYAVVPHHIGEERFARDGARLARLAAELARASADAVTPRRRLAASIPPLFGSYRPDLFEADRAHGLWEVLVKAQADLSDLLLGETLSSIEETSVLLDVCLKTGLPIWLSATLDDDQPTLRSGESVSDWLSAIDARDPGGRVETILFNCTQPEMMADAVVEARGHAARRDRPIGVYANAFPKQGKQATSNQTHHTLRDDITPDSYVQFAEEWRSLGASVIGGCCGVGPDTISAVKTHLAA